jgi:hypothetical protein
MAASEGELARERARRLRRVLDECDRVLHDKDATDEQREVAQRWQDRLGSLGPLAESAYSLGVYRPAAGEQRHTSGGGSSWHDDLVYDGWVDDR